MYVVCSTQNSSWTFLDSPLLDIMRSAHKHMADDRNITQKKKLRTLRSTFFQLIWLLIFFIVFRHRCSSKSKIEKLKDSRRKYFRMVWFNPWNSYSSFDWRSVRRDDRELNVADLDVLRWMTTTHIVRLVLHDDQTTRPGVTITLHNRIYLPAMSPRVRINFTPNRKISAAILLSSSHVIVPYVYL